MIRGWLIYSQYEAKRNDFFVGELIANAREMGIELRLLLREYISLKITKNAILCYAGQPLQNADFALVRINDFALSFQLEKMGLKVFNNSETSLICNDKYLTHCFANSLGIPTLDTTLVNKNNPHWQDVDEKLFPLVVKPLDLKGGEKVLFVKNKNDFIAGAHLYPERFLLQKPAKDLGEDTRIYLLDKKIIAVAKRKSTTDFRSNFCLGGQASIVDPLPAQIDAIEKIIKNLDVHYVGVDFLSSGKQVFLNEIEDVVGARMLYSLTDINPAKELIKSVLNKF